MTPLVFGSVLAAAAMHASWNAVVKVDLERYLSITLLAIVAALLSAFALPFVPLPHAAVWPWILLSMVLHTGYVLCLAQSYKTGELGQVYPLARGGAPLLIALATVGIGIEKISLGGFVGVLLLTGGICLLSRRSRRHPVHLERQTLVYTFATAVFIAAYTVVDGVAARLDQSPHAVTLWIFFGQGVLMLGLLLARRGPASLPVLAHRWKGGLASGALSLGAYWLIVWAMTLAPITLVAALRETSVLFATLLSAIVLHERLTPTRAVASMVILVGVMVIRLG